MSSGNVPGVAPRFQERMGCREPHHEALTTTSFEQGQVPGACQASNGIT